MNTQHYCTDFFYEGEKKSLSARGLTFVGARDGIWITLRSKSPAFAFAFRGNIEVTGKAQDLNF